MLSVLVQTYGADYAAGFLAEFGELAHELNAEFVIVGDGEAGERMARQFSNNVVRIDMQHTPEEGIRPGVEACHGDMILRFDDDESCSPAMRDWILSREWEEPGQDIFSFPYAWLWGDDRHFITSRPFWPDPHARLMTRELTEKWLVQPHAGNIFGLGTVLPVAHCHHKFLVQSAEHRQVYAAHLEQVAPGAGLGMHFGKFMFPERFCTALAIHELDGGRVGLDNWVDSGEMVRMP